MSAVAVVTGGTGGVGRATAVALAGAGFEVAVLARGEAGLEGARRDVERLGRRALALSVDVADFGAVERAARQIEAELGPVDVWVNNAMTTVFAPVCDIDPDDFARAIEVTFLGQVWGTRVALEHMRPRARGTIVNVGSSLAFLGIPLQAPYCAAKFACRGFVESLRAELAEEGSPIRVSMVHLPAVNTPQFDWCKTTLDRHPQPVPPIYQPDVAADAIVRAALDRRPTKVLGTWNKLVVAAAAVAPGVAHRFAAATGRRSQLMDEPVASDRPSNLRHPADEVHDRGAHGRFDQRAGGVLDPSFLAELPGTLRSLGVASGGALRSAVQRVRPDRLTGT